MDKRERKNLLKILVSARTSQTQRITFHSKPLRGFVRGILDSVDSSFITLNEAILCSYSNLYPVNVSEQEVRDAP